MNQLNAALQRRLDAQLALAARARALLPREARPYLAHLKLDYGTRQTDVLLGAQGLVGSGVAVIDWQTAPLAELLFSHAEGEAFDLELDDRTLSGVLLERSLVGFERGELVELETPAGVARRGEDGAWAEVQRVPPRLAARPAEAQRRGPTQVVLDAVQAGVVAQPAGTKLLLLGEAGFGKTTVALHRLARLRREDPTLTTAVLVPTEGLRRLTVELLERLGVDDAHVWCFDDWAAAEARRAFPDIPLKLSQNTPAGVIRLKRHPALRPVLDEVARRPPVLDDEAPRHALPHGRVRHGELEHVFGDAERMARVAAASDGAVTGVAVKEVLAHTHLQFGPAARDAYAHVRQDALATADGRGLDEGTPEEDADTLDAEDHAVLFELDRLRAQAQGERPTAVSGYDVLVLDEAQELAPLELALAGRSLAAGGTLVVAGDAAQQVDPTSSFLGWAGTLAELGASDAAQVTLAVSYRCPPDVTALARRIAALANERPTEHVAEQSIARVALRHELHLVAWLVEALRGLQERDPSSSIALICRTPEAARTLHRTLQHGLPVKLGLDGQVSLRSGVQVTCVAEVKGLEFDHVVVPDASARSYPATAEARRALYVAVTRATHQLVLASVGPPSPLLRDPTKPDQSP